MHTLPSFWHGAALLSGRIDLSGVDRPHETTDVELKKAGISPRHIKRLRNTTSIESSHPFTLIHESGYPKALRPLPYAPGVLFCLGNISLFHEPCIAMVGARKCSSRGRRFAEQLAGDLVGAGMVTVSGLAYGIDEAVHFARPDRTIAVLGQGIERAFDGHKRRSIERILDRGGLIVSEFLPRFPASRATFPQRNRVVSGLSLGTLVVEAGLRSGSLITARQSLEQGRELMVVPGHPLDAHAQGCNQLLFNGAALIRDATDALDCLGFSVAPQPIPSPESEVHKAILAALQSGETVDHIAATTGMPIHEVSAQVAELELTGWLSRLPGQRLTCRRPS